MEKFRMGLHRKVAVDFFNVARESIFGDPKISGNLLATATLEEKFEDDPFAW